MSNTHIVLYMPDGKTDTYNHVKSWGFNEKNFLVFTPSADEQELGGTSVTTTLPFLLRTFPK